MQHAKVCESDREVSKTSDLVVKHKTMARAVHGLHSETLAFDLKHKHVLFVGRIVARSLPQLEVENIWGQNFLVAAGSILLTNHFAELLVDLGSMRVEKCRSWG